MVDFLNSTDYTNISIDSTIIDIISDTIDNTISDIINITSNDTINNTISESINIYVKKRHKFFSFKGFVILLIDIFMVTGPSLGYLLQALKFKKTKSSKGFSKSICLIIYISQILRVFFWIGKPFKITLLYQSILIICFQIYLIYLWIKYHNTEPNKNTNNDLKYNDKKDIIEYIIDWSDTISPNKIWNWSSTIEYYKFMFLIIILLLLICGVVGIHNKILVNIIGTISVTSEASTLIPQIIVSCQKKNASNLSMSMVALWFFGDSCKFVYNIIYKTPIQMIASGGLQIFLDFFCLMQIICYKDNNPHYRSTEEANVVTNITLTNMLNTNSKKVQQINQFMNKLEERFSEEIDSNKNSKREEKENHQDKNDSKKIINKIEVPEKIENSDQVEVLDKNKKSKIEDNSDEEENNNNKNINILKTEAKENLKEKEKEKDNDKEINEEENKDNKVQ